MFQTCLGCFYRQKQLDRQQARLFIERCFLFRECIGIPTHILCISQELPHFLHTSSRFFLGIPSLSTPSFVEKPPKKGFNKKDRDPLKRPQKGQESLIQGIKKRIGIPLKGLKTGQASLKKGINKKDRNPFKRPQKRIGTPYPGH